MAKHETVNVLLVDDQPAKLLTYEVILRDLGENLIKATSGREALEVLLKTEVAVVLVDVSMPDLDGFELAAMIRDHPRFERTAIIFVSAIYLADVDRLRGYEMGAVDYVPVPVIPEVLRAKVRVFSDLYRKTRQLETLNAELEERVRSRTAELETSTEQLIRSEKRRSLALAVSHMGSWGWDRRSGQLSWDEGQRAIFGVGPDNFTISPKHALALVDTEDRPRVRAALKSILRNGEAQEIEFRVRRPDGEIRWCLGTAATSGDAGRRTTQISGVTVDVTDRKRAEERQGLLAREVDHRAKNALAVVQSILRLTRRVNSVDEYVDSVEGRVKALSRVHTVLSESRWQGADLTRLVAEELAPYRSGASSKIATQGPRVLLEPATAQTLALALHELATNAAKYGALTCAVGRVDVQWRLERDALELEWIERDGPVIRPPQSVGFGTKVILSTVERQAGGTAAFDWRAEGLRCVLRIPREGKLKPIDESGAPDSSSQDGFALSISGNRVLIAEDEALVAMALADSLTELGYSVVGPFSRTAAAILAIADRNVDAAILDISLSGEMVYPLAAVLKERGVPFVFITGYGVESVDPRFRDVPLVQKPIGRHTLPRIFRSLANSPDTRTSVRGP